MKKSGFLPSLFQRGSWIPLRVFFSYFGRLEVRGLPHLHAHKGPFIVASNHVSEFDPLLLVASLPFFSRHIPLFFVSREKSYYKVNWRGALYGGTFFTMMGAYPAYTGLNDYPSALRHHIEALHTGRSVCIFPMGGIKPRTEELRPKSGASFLAHHLQLPVLPVRIQGLEGVTAKEFYARKRTIVVTFGAPITHETLFEGSAVSHGQKSKTDYESASAVLMEKIMALR